MTTCSMLRSSLPTRTLKWNLEQCYHSDLVTSLGGHRLKQWVRNIHIYQVTHNHIVTILCRPMACVQMMDMLDGRFNSD